MEVDKVAVAMDLKGKVGGEVAMAVNGVAIAAWKGNVGDGVGRRGSGRRSRCCSGKAIKACMEEQASDELQADC